MLRCLRTNNLVSLSLRQYRSNTGFNKVQRLYNNGNTMNYRRSISTSRIVLSDQVENESNPPLPEEPKVDSSIEPQPADSKTEETPKEETTNENKSNPEERTQEEIKAERKARKEAKKKKKKQKQSTAVIDEDDVERKKREKRELFNDKGYQGDGSEIDVNSENLDDSVIIERIVKIFEEDTERQFLKMKQQLKQDKKPITNILASERYWTRFEVEKNPYFQIRFNQALSKWGNRDLRTINNEDYQNLKYNTIARMSATQKFHCIFPDIVKKFTPIINLQAQFNHPIAKDILVYYGNVIPAEFTENAPDITFKGAGNSLYTLMLVDGKSDMYLEEGYKPSIQWLITNIPGKTGDIKQGNELVEYFGATPIKEYGPSRMVFLLFRQRLGEIDIPNFKPIKAHDFHEREPFDVNEFALQNELLPRGLSFFTCTYDRTVNERYETMGIGEPVFISEEQIRKKELRKERTDFTREVTSKKWTWDQNNEDNEKEVHQN